MKWTDKSARLFTKAMEDFAPKNPQRIHKKHVEQHLLEHNLPNLAQKFVYFSRQAGEVKPIIEEAKLGKVCPCCENTFVVKPRVICRTCYRTPKGKDISKKIRGRSNKETFVKQVLAGSLEFSEKERKVIFDTIFKAVDEKGWKVGIALHNILNNIKEIPLCQHCNAKEVRLADKGIDGRRRYKSYCSTTCAAKSEYVKKKHKEAWKNLSEKEREVIQSKKENTSLKRFGVSNPAMSQQVQNKMKRTCCRRYGVSSIFKDTSRIKKGMLKKYGVEYCMQVPEIFEKARKTCLEKFGYEHFFQDTDAIRRIMKEKYGVEHSMQVPEIKQKALLSSQSLKKVECGGRTYLCQGYEKQVIPRLVQKFGVTNVVSQFDPEFESLKLENSTYTPDAYLKNKDIYIDAKSTWTFLGITPTVLEGNRQKQRELGKHLRFLIYYEKSKEIKVMPVNWYKWNDGKVRRYVKGERHHKEVFN